MRLIIAIQFLFFCNSIFSQYSSSLSEELPKHPLKSINYYCQGDTLHSQLETNFYYDENKKLIKSISSSSNSNKSVKEYKYDTNGLLSYINSYTLEKNERIDQRKLMFTYNNLSQLVYEEYESSPTIPNHTYKYNNRGQLISDKMYSSTYIRELINEYDSSGYLIKKQLSETTFILYDYIGDRIEVERCYNSKTNYISREIFYEYYNQGSIILKKQNEEVIQKNIYSNSRLIQEWNYTFKVVGDEPMPCDINGLKKFQYY